MTKTSPNQPSVRVYRETIDGNYGEWTSTGVFNCSVAPAALWHPVADPREWPRWWGGLRWTSFADGLAEGARGMMRFRGLPPARARVVAARPQQRLAVQLFCAHLLVCFDLEFEALPDGTRISEQVVVHGVGAQRFGRLFERLRGTDLALSMTRLASLGVVAVAGAGALRPPGGCPERATAGLYAGLALASDSARKETHA